MLRIQDRFGTAEIIGQVKNAGNDTISAVEVGLISRSEGGHCNHLNGYSIRRV